MQYDDFLLMIKWLKEENLTLNKEALNTLLKLNNFLQPARDCLKIIISDEKIEDKSKYLDMLVKMGNNYSSLREFCKILENPNVRDDNYFINIILNEQDYQKKSNILKAIDNPNISSNKLLFNFIFSFEDIDIQRRIINCLEFNIGIESLPKLQNASKNNIYKILNQIENTIVIDERNKFNGIINGYVSNPIQENLDLVIGYAKKLEKYKGTELAVKLDEISSFNKAEQVIDTSTSTTSNIKSLATRTKRFFLRK